MPLFLLVCNSCALVGCNHTVVNWEPKKSLEHRLSITLKLWNVLVADLAVKQLWGCIKSVEEHSEVCLIVSSSAHGTLQNCDACSAHSNKCMGMSHRLFGYCSLYMLFSDPTIVVVQRKLRQCNELTSGFVTWLQFCLHIGKLMLVFCYDLFQWPMKHRASVIGG